METRVFAEPAWWPLLPYFMLLAFSLFLTYPAWWLASALMKRQFNCGDVVREGPTVLLAAAVDTCTCAAPIFLLCIPGWYFVLGLPAGTAFMGLVYQWRHTGDWRARTAYLFALSARLVQLALMAAFMWQMSSAG